MSELLEAARDLRTALDSEGAKADLEEAPVTDAAMELCLGAGFQGALVPKVLGGAELPFGDCLDVFAEISRADGSTGWVAMAVTMARAAATRVGPTPLVGSRKARRQRVRMIQPTARVVSRTNVTFRQLIERLHVRRWRLGTWSGASPVTSGSWRPPAGRMGLAFHWTRYRRPWTARTPIVLRRIVIKCV